MLTFGAECGGGELELKNNFGINLRGLLPRETLVLIDGKRVAGASLSGNGAVDINLIPFSMIDHIDILKDGASAVYGSDAVAGVFNIFLVDKFRGLEIGGSYGNTNLGSSNDMGEWEAWLKAGTGDDKTDIVVIADFYNRAAIYSRDRYLSSNAELGLDFGGFDNRSSNFPGRVGGFRLTCTVPSPIPIGILEVFWLAVKPISCGSLVRKSVALRTPNFAMSKGR